MSDATFLPDEQEVTLLVRRFFRETGMLFPYIHEGRFWDTYGSIMRSGRRSAGARSSWLGLLNMILAMAISTAVEEGVTMKDRYSKSEVFFNRAKTLCLDQMLTGASVEAVQVMLLMTQYLQGTHRSIKTWSIHGLAVRGALQLGEFASTCCRNSTSQADTGRYRPSLHPGVATIRCPRARDENTDVVWLRRTGQVRRTCCKHIMDSG